MTRNSWKVFSVLSAMLLLLAAAGCGGGGSSAPLPAAPTSLNAEPGVGEVTLTWDAVSAATSYKIYRSTTSPVTKATGTSSTVTTNSAVISALDNGVTYYFVVTSVNANGESAESSQASATPVLPAAPTGVAAAAEDSYVTVSWTSVAGATSYYVYHSATSGVTQATGTQTASTDNSVDITGLTNGTPYYFVVTAVQNGLESADSSQVTATPVPDVPPPPSAPTGVGASAGAASATVTWTAVSGATSYNVYYSTTTGVTTSNGTKVEGATSGTPITGLIRGIPYYFIVTGVNAGGEGTASSQVNATPLAPNPTFALSDLAGTWNVRVLQAGTTAGWYSREISIDASGIVSSVGSGGTMAPPAVSAYSITTGTGIAAGVVTETGASSNATFHGKMSSGKNMIVGVSTASAGTFALHVMVKRQTGVTFSSADLASKTLKYNRIYSGAAFVWEAGIGATDASAVYTLTDQWDRNGDITPVSSPDTLSVNTTTGIVTSANEPTFYGVMTPDKKIIVATSTDGGGAYSLRILQVRGQSYAQADIVGSYTTFSFHSDSTSSWAYATWTTDVAGDVAITNVVADDGPGADSSSSGRLLEADGEIGTQGMLSYGKNLFTNVDDYSDGGSFTISVQ